MDPRATTSFIPKKPLQEAPRTETHTGGLLMFGSIFLLVTSMALAGGVFLYKGYIEKKIAAQSDVLGKAEAAFDPELIRKLYRLDSRITEGKKLLQAHVAVSPFLELLGKTTLQNVAFQSFDFTLANGKGSVALKGQAFSFSDLALQSDTFAKTQQIRDPLFSNLNLDQAGNVIFALTAAIDPSLLLYRSNIPVAPPAQNPAQQPTQ